jgi:prefoldin subunit 5
MQIKWGIRSLGGLVLVILAVISLLLDAAGILQVWMMRERITQDAITSLDLLNSTLDTTAQGLSIAKSSLQSVTATVGALQTTVASTANTIDSASGAVNSLSGIVGKNLSGTVNSALTTLDAVANTTRTLDDFLASVSKLPFVNLNYNPDKPLSASVGDLTNQLKDVPRSLNELQTNLNTSGSSLTQVGQDARALAGNLKQVEQDLNQLVGVIDRYDQQVKAFQVTVRNLRENIVTVVWGIVLFLTFILFWLGVTIVMTLFRGLEWMGIRVRLPE